MSLRTSLMLKLKGPVKLPKTLSDMNDPSERRMTFVALIVTFTRAER